jgi:DNA-binding NarL/FixJ family response regulator
LEEARAAIGALRGDELPGPERLHQLADAFAGECRVTVTGTPRELSSEARLALYRTAQEALTNVLRHSAADRVEIRLSYEDDGTRLLVQDHGPGAPVAVRVLLADDQRVVREGLGTLLGLLDGIELVGTAADGEEAVALAAEHDPDVVLMDLRMPRVDGIEAIRRLAARGERPRAIALTTYADDASVLGALRAGARGYLTKDAGAEQIRSAVQAVARGEAALDPAVQHHVLAALTEPSPELPDGLTPREAEVLRLIAEGLTNAEIAERLVVTPATVKSHVNHIFAKAGVRDRAQAVVYAYSRGLV